MVIRPAGCQSLTLCISGERRQKPVHVRLRHGSCGLNEKVGQERRGIQPVVPVDRARIRPVESDLHDDGPYVYANVEDDNSEEPDLGPASLTDSFHVEDEAETEAADTTSISPRYTAIRYTEYSHAKKGRNER